MLDTELQISASKLALALVNDNKIKLFFNHQGKKICQSILKEHQNTQVQNTKVQNTQVQVHGV